MLGATTVQQPQVSHVLWQVLLREPGYFIGHFWRPLMFVVAIFLAAGVKRLIVERRLASKRS